MLVESGTLFFFTLILVIMFFLLLFPPLLFLESGKPQLISYYKYNIPIENKTSLRLKKMVERKTGWLILVSLFYLPYFGLFLFVLLAFPSSLTPYVVSAIWFASFLVFAMNTGTILALVIELKMAKSTKQKSSL